MIELPFMFHDMPVRIMMWKDKVYLDCETLAEALFQPPCEFAYRYRNCGAFEYVPFDDIAGGLGVNAEKLDFLVKDETLQVFESVEFVEQFSSWLANSKEELLAEDRAWQSATLKDLKARVAEVQAASRAKHLGKRHKG